MNFLKAKVRVLKSMENLTLLTLSMGDQELKMVSLGLPKDIEQGSTVLLGVKATNITLAKNLQGEISTSNQLFAQVESVKNGEILSTIKLKIEDSFLESVITETASSRLCLQSGDSVLVLIKASDLSILEVREF